MDSVNSAQGRAGNALRHGLTATKLLPHLLRPERLEELRAQLREEYQPTSITEELLVSEAARHAAALELIEQAEPAVMRQAVQTLELILQVQQQSDDWALAAAVTGEPLDRCARYRRAHEKSLHQALDKLRLLAASKLADGGDQSPALAPAPALASEQDCQRYLRQFTFAAAWRCPHCKSPTGHWLDRRHVWQCAKCDKQTGSRHGTVFARSSLPLLAWFTAVRIVAGKTDIDAEELAGAIGISRLATVRSMLRRIRQAISAGDYERSLAGLTRWPLPPVCSRSQPQTPDSAPRRNNPAQSTIMNR